MYIQFFKSPLDYYRNNLCEIDKSPFIRIIFAGNILQTFGNSMTVFKRIFCIAMYLQRLRRLLLPKEKLANFQETTLDK